MTHRQHSRRGTVYVVVLAVLSIVITVSLSSLTNARTELAAASTGADEATARLHARSALEAALTIIGQNPDWRADYPDGDLIPKAQFGHGVIRVTATDPYDSDLLDDYADPIELTATVEHGNARQMYRYRFDRAATHTMSPDTVLRHRPIAYWPLWDLNGDRAADLVALRDARLKGKIHYDSQDPTGVYNMPMLHSTLQTYYEIDHQDPMELDYGSVSVWFQPSSLYISSGTIQIVCSKHAHDEPDALQFSIICNNGRVGLLLDHNYALRAHNIGDITGDTWHHVVLTWGPAGWSTYLDGKPAGILNHTLGLGKAWTSEPNEERLRFGAAKGLLGRHGDTGMGHYFHGKICEAAIFAYELTPEQIQQLASNPPTERPLSINHQSITRVID